MVQGADQLFDQKVLHDFDIVSWDPRGVGAGAVHCTDRLDFFYEVDRSRVDASTERANAAAARRLVDSCSAASAGELPYISTSATADDMDAIRAAMGERTISYIGFSYGTYLGALYAQRYPTRVRAMVLDGAVDPALTYDASAMAQALGFEHALDAFLGWCASDDKCAFARGGDPKTAFADLVSSLGNESLPAEVDGRQRTLGRGEADIGIAQALYAGKSDNGWQRLGEALEQAAKGDGSGLLALSDLYTGRRSDGTYDTETAASYAIGCLDAPAPPTVAAVARLAARAAAAAPSFGASTVWLGLPCTFWPARPVGRPGPVRAPGAPPILVVGTTDDPATPYAGAQALARELTTGHLLTYEGEGHTAYGRGDACIDGAVDDYLIASKLPPAGSRCR